MKQNMNQSVAENIRKIRTLKALDTRVVADHLGLSLSAYTKLERGETQIDIGRANGIAELLGVNIADILTFDLGEMFTREKHANASCEDSALWESLREQLRIKDEQIKAKDEQLRSLHRLLEEILLNSAAIAAR